jgi:hypothetical protein
MRLAIASRPNIARRPTTRPSSLGPREDPRTMSKTRSSGILYSVVVPYGLGLHIPSHLIFIVGADGRTQHDART